MNKALNQEDGGDGLGGEPFPSARGLPAHSVEWWLVHAYGWVAHCGKVAG